MAALIFLLLNLGASLFKSRCRLEAENAALRRQLIVLQRKVRGRVEFTNSDRLFFIQLYPQGHHDLPARDPRALAPCWFSPLLALEISKPGRPAADRGRFAGIDPADER